MAAKVIKDASKWKPKASIKRPGVVSKKKSSSLKTSKNYLKKYKGQGWNKDFIVISTLRRSESLQAAEK